MSMREVHIRYRINEDSSVQLFLAKVFERHLEEGVSKLFNKAFTKKVVEELEAKEDIDGLVEPVLFFEEDGMIVRSSMKEGDGRDTEADPEQEKALEAMFSDGGESGGGSIEVTGANSLIDALEEGLGE